MHNEIKKYTNIIQDKVREKFTDRKIADSQLFLNLFSIYIQINPEYTNTTVPYLNKFSKGRKNLDFIVYDEYDKGFFTTEKNYQDNYLAKFYYGTKGHTGAMIQTFNFSKFDRKITLINSNFNFDTKGDILNIQVSNMHTLINNRLNEFNTGDHFEEFPHGIVFISGTSKNEGQLEQNSLPKEKEINNKKSHIFYYAPFPTQSLQIEKLQNGIITNNSEIPEGFYGVFTLETSII